MITEKDVKILSHLRNNARKKITEIAKETGISATTIYDRVRTHEKSLVKRYVTMIDFTKIGLHATTNFAIKCAREDREKLSNFLVNHENINSLHRVNYGFDFLAEGIFRNIKESQQFGEQLEKEYQIDQILLFNIIEELKKEGLLSKPEHFSSIIGNI